MGVCPFSTKESSGLRGVALFDQMLSECHSSVFAGIFLFYTREIGLFIGLHIPVFSTFLHGQGVELLEPRA